MMDLEPKKLEDMDQQEIDDSLQIYIDSWIKHTRGIFPSTVREWEHYPEFMEFCANESIFINHSVVLVYCLDNDFESNTLNERRGLTLEALKVDFKDNMKAYRRAGSILDQVIIGVSQDGKISSLNQNIESLQEELNEAKKGLASYEKKLTKAKDDLAEATNKLYAGFISVLGIFIATSFTMFSAANLINNIFNPARRNGHNIMLAGIVFILLYLMLIGFFIGVLAVIRIITKDNEPGISSIIREPRTEAVVARVSIWILSTAIGVVFFGFLYGHKTFDFAHAGKSLGILFVYLLLAVVFYRVMNGRFISRWLSSEISKKESRTRKN